MKKAEMSRNRTNYDLFLPHLRAMMDDRAIHYLRMGHPDPRVE